MPQSLSVFAVSLQEHPELLKCIMHFLVRNVKSYYWHSVIIGTCYNWHHDTHTWVTSHRIPLENIPPDQVLHMH